MNSWAFDTEDDGKGNPFLYNFFNGKKHFTFTKQEHALNFFCEDDGRAQYWATNLGYDLNNLFKNHMKQLDQTYIDSRLIKAKLKNTQVYFFDTLNQWKLSVKKMGERIGLSKIEIDGAKTFKIYSRQPQRIIEYCRRDTEISWRFVESMRVEYEKLGCKIKATIGSTALDAFQRNFYRRPEKSEILNPEEINFIRKGIYGGRTEIFFNSPIRGIIHYIDINSLYASVLHKNAFPDLTERFFTRKPDLSKEGMIDATLEAPQKLKIPYLPVRSDKGLIFPTGVFRGFYTYFEIRKALELGYSIQNTHRSLEFSGVVYPFQNFISQLWERRYKAQIEGDALMEDTCKLLMNNLWGKYTQGNEYTRLCEYDENVDGSHNVIMFDGDLSLRKVRTPFPSHANQIWGAYTTAYARHRLYTGLKTISESGGLLIYCDTDSIIYEASKALIEPSKELGEFKLEKGSPFKYAWFKNPKLYRLDPFKGDRIYKAKGVPKTAQKVFFEKGTAKYRKPLKLRECLRRSLGKKKKLVPNEWVATTKEMKTKYEKRKVLKNGETKPWHLPSKQIAVLYER